MITVKCPKTNKMSSFVNVNDTVEVKLTEAGKTVYREHYEELFPAIYPGGKKIVDGAMLRIKEDGTLSIQLYDLMHIFGKHFYMGMPKPLFEKNDIKFDHE